MPTMGDLDVNNLSKEQRELLNEILDGLRVLSKEQMKTLASMLAGSDSSNIPIEPSDVPKEQRGKRKTIQPRGSGSGYQYTADAMHGGGLICVPLGRHYNSFNNDSSNKKEKK